MQTPRADRSANAVTSVERAQSVEHACLGSAYGLTQPWFKNSAMAPAGVLT